MVEPDGKSRVVRLGQSRSLWSDLYHFLLALPWSGFLGLIALLYLAINTLFALAYLLGGDCIQNARPGSFIDAFSFSVQTMATIGYGAMYPTTTYAHSLVAFEALVGLLGFAMATGLMFARFSRPTARVLFSRIAAIAPQNGVPTLMFRTANQRRNQILEANIWVALARSELNEEGQFMRRIHDLKLIRNRTPIFALSWTVMHPIDQNSPLWGATPESLDKQAAEIIVTLTGLDDTFSQTVHARHSYIAAEILWDRYFVDLFSQDPDGRYAIDYRHFHHVKPLQ